MSHQHKKTGRRITRRTRVWLGLAAVSAGLVGFVPAASVGSSGFDVTVTSGSSAWFNSTATPNHAWTDLKVRQDGSDPGTPGEYRFVNTATGATTSAKVSFGGLQTWTGIVAGTHRLQAHRQTPADTNGWLPGSGNTRLWGAIFW